MKVKLTRREPTQAACDAGVDKIDANTRCDVSNYGLSADVEIDDEAPQECWQAMHDAAPDDATRALVRLVRGIRDYEASAQGGTITDGANALKATREALDRLRATPEGAALIRQAEERDDG